MMPLSQLVAPFSRKYSNTDNAAALPALHTKRGVLHVLRLVAEDTAQETFLRRELGLALRCYFAHENVAGAYFRADADNALLVEILQTQFANVWDVVRCRLGAKFRIAHNAVKVLNMHGCKLRLLHEALGDDDSVFIVCAVPAHESDAYVLAERELALVGGGIVGEHVAFFTLSASVTEGLCMNAEF